MQKPKLTGALILFIAWTAIAGANGLRELGSVETTWKPYMADQPSLQGAVLIFQALTGAGILAWLFTAWMLYQREPGTLNRAQTSLLIGALLRLLGGWSIVLFGRLPAEMVQRLMPQVGFISCLILLFTGVWYLYLLRSQRVREIYAG